MPQQIDAHVLMLVVVVVLALITLWSVVGGVLIARKWKRKHKNLESLHATLVQRYYALLAKQPRAPDSEDVDRLTEHGREFVDALEEQLGQPNEISLCTMGTPTPAIEVIYDDYIITLTMSIDYNEGWDDDEGDADAGEYPELLSAEEVAQGKVGK